MEFIVLLIMGLVEAVKRAGFPEKLCGLLAVAFGLAASISIAIEGGNSITFETIEIGIMLGLIASGIWSNLKPLWKRSDSAPLPTGSGS